MSRRTAYLDHLAEIPMFSACSRKELKEIGRRAEDVVVPAGKVLCEEGKAGKQFFVIAGGQADVRRNGRKVATLSTGDFFGELSLLDNGPRNATVTAATDLEVVVLERSAFTDLLNDVPTLGYKVAAGLAHRLHQADKRPV